MAIFKEIISQVIKYLKNKKKPNRNKMTFSKMLNDTFKLEVRRSYYRNYQIKKD